MKANFSPENRRTSVLLCFAGLLLFVAPARALVSPRHVPRTTVPTHGDPPSRVARVSYLDGNVSLQPGGEGDWGSGGQESPGHRRRQNLDRQGLSRRTCRPAQASIHMGSMTALSFLNLDENIMQVRVAEGAINFRVRELREGDVYEVDTPNLAFTVKQAGAFRVDVNEDGDGTRVTAIRGEGEITAGGKTYDVHAGEKAEFNGTDNPEYNVHAAPARMVSIAGPPSATCAKTIPSRRSTFRVTCPATPTSTTTAPGMKSRTTARFGIRTQVAVGWAPYSYGYWNWVGPWGWTWVGYEPWGFAPYHYGRWSYIGSRWGWCPGPIYARPFYGPAFVGLLRRIAFRRWIRIRRRPESAGSRWASVSRIIPGSTPAAATSRNINVRNTVIRNANVLNEHATFNYAYARNTRAVTVASRNAFVNGQAINRSSIRVTRGFLRGAA